MSVEKPLTPQPPLPDRAGGSQSFSPPHRREKSWGEGGVLLSLIIPLLLSGCLGASPKIAYHTLGSVAVGDVTEITLRKPVPSLGVGPVYVPTLLDRQGVVLRKDRYTVEVAEFHEWGGELEDEFLGALAQRLQERLPAATAVLTVPWELEQTPLYQVTVHIAQFDGIPGRQAVLKGRWQLQQAKSGHGIRSAKFNLQQVPIDDSVAGLVRAQSQLVDDLALEILTGF